ncbi:class I SAM-dependent methyltransferase [Geodermatophilus sp. URMC 64]
MVLDPELVDVSPAPGRRMPWPVKLKPYLNGTSVISLRPVDGGPDVVETGARFGDSPDPVRFEDRFGIGLIINKFSNIGHALADYDPQTIPRMLDHVDEVREVLAKHFPDLDVYVMGGTLLGPYRDGKIMRHDDDADLGYLSRHTHPVDVVRENFVIGRALRGAGLNPVRASGGHLQIHFAHDGKPDAYVDLFTGFIDDDGWFQHTFAVRARATRDQIVPPITIDVEGRPEPAPRTPEIMLEANYGPGWRTPDPAFRFNIPQSMQDRFWGWFSDYGMDRTVWEDWYRYDIEGERVPLGSAPSDYARWLHDRIPADAPILELGAGRGHDALWLAEQGHRVEAIDYVRWPTARAQQTADERQLPARFRTMNINDLRRMLVLGAEVAARREPVVVYARDLLATVWDVTRPQLLRLLSMVLRSGGQAHLDVPRADLMPVPGTGVPLHRATPLERLAEEMAPYGLRTEETLDTEETLENLPWNTEGKPLPTTRMVVTWQRRA